MSIAINEWKCKKPIHDKACAFVETQRSVLGILGANEEVTTELLRNHPEQGLPYYGHILGDMEQLDDANKFTLTPVFQTKSHFITIDTRVLYKIMQKCGLFSGKVG